MRVSQSPLIPEALFERFEFYNYNHALEILYQAYPVEYGEILQALDHFELTVEDIKQQGGSKSPIPPKFETILTPLGWDEVKLSGDLHLTLYPRHAGDSVSHKSILCNYIDGHNIDFYKGRIACDVEWNSKDQTFDRDLFAFRTFYECGIISAAVIITRSEELNGYFKMLGEMQKYGASTTWMGKLLPRLESRRHGGCPILAIGIRPSTIKGVIIQNQKEYQQ
ncbi:MAG: BglII/BstYI family type II restriction endonuclease [Sphaerochaetaceae bacterium]|nr:BglII/BstYI family type II restriction endonuclease [Sphaerochaetaceae bacterium]